LSERRGDPSSPLRDALLLITAEATRRNADFVAKVAAYIDSRAEWRIGNYLQ